MIERLQQRLPNERDFLLYSLAGLCVLWMTWVVAAGKHFEMWDFVVFRDAAIAVMHGHTPYPPATTAALLQEDKYVYPALVAYLFVPFALLPVWLSGAIYFVLMLAAAVGFFLVLGIRDRRCIVAPFVAWPMMTALGNGALGPFLALGLALAWRNRDRTTIAAPLLALIVVAKLFLWPLAIWLVAARRFTTAAVTAAVSVVLLVLPFVPIGLSTLRDYPHLMHRLDATLGPISYTPRGLLRTLGASTALLTATEVVLAIIVVAATALAGRAREEKALAVALTGAILLSPIAWPHYFVLVYVALALCVPRLSPVWFAPLAFELLPGLTTDGNPLRAALGISIAVVVALACVGVPRIRLPELGRRAISLWI